MKRLKKTGAKLVWAATTPVPEGEAGRHQGDAARYNKIAAKIMNAHGVAINDLHAHMLPQQKKFMTAPGNVHFTTAGSKFLAEKVVAEIRKAIKNTAPTKP